MHNCSYCNSFILFGGAADDTGRYCNERCQQAGNLVSISQHVPEQVLDVLVHEVHSGSCPKCRRPGPVDMHKAHKVWSALFLTSWSSSPELSCKGCAVKRQIGASLFSGVLGWWGFPWGLIMTPLQIIRNVIEMAGGPPPTTPSPLLRSAVRMQAAAQGLSAPPAYSQPSAQPVYAVAPPPLPLPPDESRYRPR